MAAIRSKAWNLELVDAEGRVRATTVTEFDGYFLFEGGRLRRVIRVAAGQGVGVRALRLDGAFAIGAVPGQGARPRVRLGTLVLKPLRREVSVQESDPPGGNSARGPPGGEVR